MKNSYSPIIESYVKRIIDKLKDNLEMIYIIGSSATEDVVANWSDIDVIIVLKEYVIEDIEIIKKVSNSYEIKIGNTLYSKKEFENKYIDSKTYYYLYLYNNNVLDITYLNKDLIIPKITFEECLLATKIVLLNDLHNLKRLLTYDFLSNQQLKVMYKKLYVIMKSILIINKKFPKNYEETFKMFSKEFNFEYFDYLKFIDNFRNDNVSRDYMIKYSYDFIIYITNMIADKKI